MKTTLKLWAVLMLVASFALAQPTVTRGGALKKRQYQTYAAMTLYVDPTGNDANACTASGTSACLTLAGVLSKVPRFIRHAVTVNIAAGTYAEPFTVENFSINGGVTFSITGTMSTATLATGSTTGTVTAVTAGSATTYSSITDSSQTLTSNDLRGKFITFTSGTLNGQSYPISSNTGTIITLPFTTSPGVGATYTLNQVGSVFTPSANSNIRGLDGAGSVTFTNIGVTRASGTGLSPGVPLSTSTECVNCVVTCASGNGFIISAPFSLTRSYVAASSNAVTFSASAAAPRVSQINVNVLRSTSTGAAFSSLPAAAAAYSLNTIHAESASTILPVLSLSGGVLVSQVSSLFVSCTGGAGSVGIGTTNYVAGTVPSTGMAYNNGFTLITGCETGIKLTGRVNIMLTGMSITNATTGISLLLGARFSFLGGTPTFSTVTNELSLDGTNYTFATLTGLTPAVISNAYGSTFIW